MGSNKVIVVAALLAAAACRDKEADTAPVKDDGAGPPGAGGGAKGPGVTESLAGAPDVLGDPLPAGATARLGSARMLDRHLENMRYLPGGAQLVSASYDRYVV